MMGDVNSYNDLTLEMKKKERVKGSRIAHKLSIR